MEGVDRMAIPVVVFAAALACSAVEVERIFRPERLTRGDTNVRVLQPIDEAAWIWAAEIAAALGWKGPNRIRNGK